MFPVEVREFYGKQLILPERAWYFWGEQVKPEPVNRLKIVIYYDLFDCIPCKSKEFSLWRPLLDEVRNKNIPVRIIPVCSSANDTFIHALYESNDLDIPCIWDRQKEFEKTNILPDNPLYHTFLLDEENKICLIGTPLYNPDLWLNYKKVIDKLKD